MHMAGLLVDVYGLDRLPAASDKSAGVDITCLWLLHPRQRTRGTMGDIGRRAVATWTSAARQQQSTRRLLALAFDMPNHGSREVDARANRGWAQGNAAHAVDMAGMVRGACLDLGLLMDLVGGYLGTEVDGHVVLGWSLGGHAAWQAVMTERRLDAAVVVVGCPDYTALLTHRAQENKLPSPLIGTSYFPNSLLSALSSCDPASILFAAPNAGPRVPTTDIPPHEQTRLRSILDSTLRGKRVLCCSGKKDTLVPYTVGTQPFLALLDAAARKGGWYADGQLEVQDRVYHDAGHEFCAAMVQDAVEFIIVAVAAGPHNKTGPS
ncbi:hypothetical protein CDD82_5184 [Ophiocordyceps australis]|uniref:AB hydrolase-1 domain-containing protein n=1 Tax=Ophiocordyceps australis TaxID=1399860 RepID=A0A2C5Z438_9HYPO|nr:hypothetical protein CDD82_5184 [Ophiocordyceps australis]